LTAAIAVFGVLEVTDWTALLGSETAGWVLTPVAIANMVLRSLTHDRRRPPGLNPHGRAGSPGIPCRRGKPFSGGSCERR
jgi:hypothetical protein